MWDMLNLKIMYFMKYHLKTINNKELDLLTENMFDLRNKRNSIFIKNNNVPLSNI